MNEPARSWGAGIVNHGSYDDLDRCLDALASQSHPPSAIFVYDTGEDPERFEQLARDHVHVKFELGDNRGYAGGANRVIDRLCATAPEIGEAGKACDEPAFVIVMNPDVILNHDFAEKLIDAVVHAPAVAIATGKLLRPDRRTLDSAGIVFPRHRRPRDRGSEELDRGQYDLPERVDAASGAVLLLRVCVLQDLALEGEVFDESFFAYHEDTDLCWRARRFGYEVLYEPRAVAIHARGWQKRARERIPVEIRRHSFKNHYLQVVKNETVRGGLLNLPWLLGWEVLRLGFAILRDRPMLLAYVLAWRALPTARRRRALVNSRAGEAKQAQSASFSTAE